MKLIAALALVLSACAANADASEHCTRERQAREIAQASHEWEIRWLVLVCEP